MCSSAVGELLVGVALKTTWKEGSATEKRYVSEWTEQSNSERSDGL